MLASTLPPASPISARGAILRISPAVPLSTHVSFRLAPPLRPRRGLIASSRLPSLRVQATFPPFVPEEAKEVEEESALQFLRRINRLPVQTGLSSTPVESSCVVPGNAGSTDTPLLLLHGFDSSCLEWRRTYPALEAQGLEPWAVDILGWGFNAAPGVTSYSVPAKREHLVQFWRQHMGGRPAVLVGASLGGAVAIDLALEHPEMVSSLVLVDAQGYTEGAPGGDFPEWLARAAIGVLKSQPLRLYAGTMAYYNQSLATRDAMRVGRLHCHMPGWSDAKLAFMRSGGYRVADRIKEVQKRALVVWGAQDKILDKKYAEMFLADLSGASLEVVEDCGHCPHLEKPEVFAQILEQFLARTPSLT